MKYMGSKNRIAKYIMPIILKDRKPGNPLSSGLRNTVSPPGRRTTASTCLKLSVFAS
jgi:hypothetical protein